MLAVQFADHGAVGDVERGEQAGDAVADVVVGASLGHARHHRQDRLGAVQGLDLGLLVDAEHHRALGRVVVEPDDVDDLLDEQRVGGQLERLGRCGLRPKSRQIRPIVDFDSPDLSAIDVRDQCVALRRCLLQRRHDHVLDLVQSDRRRPARPILIDQPLQTLGQEPPPPLADRRRMHAQRCRDLDCWTSPRRTPARSCSATPTPATTSPAATTAPASPAPQSVNLNSAFGRPVLAMPASLTYPPNFRRRTLAVRR